MYLIHLKKIVGNYYRVFYFITTPCLKCYKRTLCTQSKVQIDFIGHAIFVRVSVYVCMYVYLSVHEFGKDTK